MGEYADNINPNPGANPWGFRTGDGAPGSKDGWPVGKSSTGLPRTGPMPMLCCDEAMTRLDTTVPHVYLHRCEKCGNEINEVDAQGPAQDRLP